MAMFYFARRAPKLRIHSFYWKSAVEQVVVFKMRNSVPRTRYSAICNVLRQWKASLILESTDSMIIKEFSVPR